MLLLNVLGGLGGGMLRYVRKDLTGDLRRSLAVGVGAEDELGEAYLVVGRQFFGGLLGSAYYGGA